MSAIVIFINDTFRQDRPRPQPLLVAVEGTSHLRISRSRAKSALGQHVIIFLE